MKFNLGDRVRVNETCKYQELIGDEAEVIGLDLRKDRIINVTISDEIPWRGKGGSDGWSESELDKI